MFFKYLHIYIFCVQNVSVTENYLCVRLLLDVNDKPTHFQIKASENCRGLIVHDLWQSKRLVASRVQDVLIVLCGWPLPYCQLHAVGHYHLAHCMQAAFSRKDMLQKCISHPSEIIFKRHFKILSYKPSAGLDVLYN